MDYTVHEILQARVLELVACPFSSESAQPRNWTGVSCIAGGFFTNWAIRETRTGWEERCSGRHPAPWCPHRWLWALALLLQTWWWSSGSAPCPQPEKVPWGSCGRDHQWSGGQSHLSVFQSWCSLLPINQYCLFCETFGDTFLLLLQGPALLNYLLCQQPGFPQRLLTCSVNSDVLCLFSLPRQHRDVLGNPNATLPLPQGRF